MKIIGFASLNHDPAVALLSGGELLAAIESEKITRLKHEVSVFPDRALTALLGMTELQLSDIDYIATNYDAGPLSNAFYLPQLLRMSRRRCFDWGAIVSNIVIAGSHSRRMFAQLPDIKIPKIVNVRHHRAHLASSFLASPWEEAAAVVIDAAGELECTSVWSCSGRKVNKLYSMDMPADSLGCVYMLATRQLGFRMLGDEYKVMGLAAHGRPNAKFREFFKELIFLKSEGRYEVSAKLLGPVFDGGWTFPHRTRLLIGPSRQPGATLQDAHADFARELQTRVEEAILHVIKHARTLLPTPRLCLAGGVALNCVANGRVLRQGGFEEVFVPPAPHDAGTAVGAALHHHFYGLGGDRPAPISSAFLGPGFSDEAIEKDLRKCGQEYVRVSSPAFAAAEALVNGLVIGWFQGRTEFGPRALGNRSILADARLQITKDLVNTVIKERESFRPFAPAILESEATKWLDFIRKSPWMLFVDKIREERRSEVPAVVHVDGTARPQTVSRTDNPLFHDLIQRFFELTKVPIILNTSFNVAGEPMVNTPSEAIRCFHGSGLNALIIGSFVLRKPGITWAPA